MSASSGADFEASARQVARYKPKPTFGDVGNCPAAVSVATARTSKIVYFDGSQTLRIALAIGSPTPCSEITTVRRSSGASNARRVTSSTRSGGLLRILDLARGDFHSPTARSPSFVRYPRRLACAPTSAKSQASVAASRSVCPSTYARLHRRTNARSTLGDAIAFRCQLFALFFDPGGRPRRLLVVFRPADFRLVVFRPADFRLVVVRPVADVAPFSDRCRPRFTGWAPVASSRRCRSHRSSWRLRLPSLNRIDSAAGLPSPRSHTTITASMGPPL